MERETNFPSKGFQIAGTFSLPDSGSNLPAVLLIPGSGQIDRNENHKKLRLNLFNELSDYLTGKGFAVLRYDKRGIGSSSGDYWETGFYDNISDALSALEFLRNQNEIDASRIFLLGHSEGAFISTNIAGQGADISGIVLLAGGTHSGEETLKWQALKVVEGMKGLNKWLINIFHLDVAKSQQKQLDKIKKSTKDYYRIQMISKLNAKWMREFLMYDPSEDFSRINVPVLAITGEKDIQVNPQDLVLLKEIVKSDYEYHILSDVSHLLRPEQGEPSLSHYKKMVQQPIDERIPEIIGNWLKKQTNSK